MMTREQAFALVNDERTRQDAGYPDRSQYERLAPHIVLLDVKVDKLKKAAWYKDEDTKAQLVQLAALAIRALEETKEYL